MQATEPKPTTALGPSGRQRLAMAPLWAVMLLTGLNSVASGITFNGLSFVAESSFGYGPMPNSAMALLMGITYTIGAAGAGRFTRAWRRRWTHLTGKTLLLLMALVMAALCSLPAAVWFAVPHQSRQATAPVFWVFAACYSGLTGMFWPLVEAFLSGGRKGEVLRTSMGRWNIVWSGSLIFSLVVLGPLSRIDSVLALALAAGLHLTSLLAWRALPSEPGEHLLEQAHTVPPVYHQLLAVHRVLLPTAYMVMYALTPILPALLGILLRNAGIDQSWKAPIAAVWLLARVVTFLVLGHWHGWHGRWLTATGGMACLMGGFALTLLTPFLAAGNLALFLAVVGLCVYGIGAASIYTAALYYVLEVHSAEVDAGGSHEALIGVGYTVGPICSLLPAVLVASGVVSEAMIGPGTLGLVGVCAAAAVTVSVRFRNPRGLARYPSG